MSERKKKKVNKSLLGFSVLSNEQYFHWKYLISEMQKEKNLFSTFLEKVETLKCKERIARLELELFKRNLSDYKQRTENAENRYVEYRGKLSAELGMALDDVVIDESTLEIKPINNKAD